MTALTALRASSLDMQHPNQHKYQTTVSMTTFRLQAHCHTESSFKTNVRLAEKLHSLYMIRTWECYFMNACKHPVTYVEKYTG